MGVGACVHERERERERVCVCVGERLQSAVVFRGNRPDLALGTGMTHPSQCFL